MYKCDLRTRRSHRLQSEEGEPGGQPPAFTVRARIHLTGKASLPMFRPTRRPQGVPGQPLQSEFARNFMNIVVVESPAKAKTINKYLGPGYEVLASFGHVRDLPAKNG